MVTDDLRAVTGHVPDASSQSEGLAPYDSSKNVEKLRELAGLLLDAQEKVNIARDVERSFNYRVKLAERVCACSYALAVALDELEMSLRRWT